MSRSVGDVTAGLDIGTTSVKALVVDGEGRVLARARRAHGVRTPEPDCFEHDAAQAWRANVEQALREVRDAAGVPIAAVNVAAMVPSLCAVDRDGAPLTPGLLYGDRRGGQVTGKNPSESGEFVHFLEWCATSAPDAAGYWPAQAVANHTLCGTGAIDTVVAMTTVPLFDFTGWDESVAAAAGVRVDQLPALVVGSEPAGEMGDGTLVGGGTVDAFAEQLVAGADHEGDVLVILGTTLITWAVVSEWVEVPGLWTVPHTAPGKVLIGGPSNAGGLFLGFVDRLLGHGVAPDPAGGTEMDRGLDPYRIPVYRDSDGCSSDRRTEVDCGDCGLDPYRIPVWEPYVRGERTPLHDPHRRAVLHDLDLTMGPAQVRRAAFEASGFVVRHHLDLAGVRARRIVATGGGVRVEPWVQALADCTGLPVDVVAVPEGGAYGAAYLARVVAGLEPDASGASRWAATARTVEPDGAWQAAAAERYERFRSFSG